MIPPSLIALDVGGVIYYDEPFDLAWIQRILDRTQATDPSFTVTTMIAEMERFFVTGRCGTVDTGSVFSTPLAGACWADVRRQWNALAMPLPGAVAAVCRLAAAYEVCVVANQPPECDAVLQELGVAPLMRLVALDSLVGYAKPDPRLLSVALDRTDHPPHRTLVVGNRVDHDLVPARQLGCRTALILPDDGWRAPAGTDPEIVRAYTRMRPRSPDPSDLSIADQVATGLPDLAATLANAGLPAG